MTNTAGWCPTPGTAPTKDPANVQSTVNVSYLCENGWQPLLITGFFRDALIRQWSNAANIVAPEMKQYLWSEQPGSGILIESVFRYRPEMVEKRPAIMIKRNSMRNMPIGMNSLITGVGANEYQTERGAIERYTTLFVGSHTFFCIHRSGAATEMLATEVLTHMVESMPPIRRFLGLRQFAVTEFGAIQELEESTENFVIPITIGWCYDHTWELREESLPLQSIALSSLLGSGSSGIGTPFQGV